MHALLVEDDAATAKSVELMLRSRGHRCDTTALGEQAVELATRNAYDVILLDIMLPDIDGYEVLRRLHEANIRTPVLIQSGLVDRNEQLASLGFGVDNFLVKPYARDELEERIGEAIANTGGDEAAGDTAGTDTAGPHTAVNGLAGDGDHSTPGSEHDAAPVTKVLRSGQIVFQNGNCAIDCTLLEISAVGAALKPANLLECPKFFTLKIRHGADYNCEVCWRFNDKMGVRFLDT